MTKRHAVVWLDHHHAEIIRFGVDSSRAIEIHSNGPHRKVHRKARVIGSGHAPDDHDFFDEIAAAIGGVGEVLLCGPGNAKTALHTYLGDRHPAVAEHIVGVETVDHPSSGQLLQFAKQHFRRIDQLGLVDNSG